MIEYSYDNEFIHVSYDKKIYIKEITTKEQVIKAEGYNKYMDYKKQ